MPQQIVRAVDLARYLDPDGWTVQVDEIEYSDSTRRVMLYVWWEDAEDGTLVLEKQVASIDEGLRLMRDTLAMCKESWYEHEVA